MGKFTFTPTGIAGMMVVEPTLFGDARGYFMETYNYNEFAAAGLDMTFVQDNQSKSKRGVLRGLHFQTKNSQGKLVRVIRGEVFDVGVDLAGRQRHLRPMVRPPSERGEPQAALYSRGLCPWLPGHQRGSGIRL